MTVIPHPAPEAGRRDRDFSDHHLQRPQSVFDGARDDIETGLRAGTISTSEDAEPAAKLLLARGLARLTPERAAELRARLAALFDEFSADGDGAAPGLPAYGLVLSMYAMPDTADTADPEETER